MKYRTPGATGLPVSVVGVGTWPFGEGAMTTPRGEAPPAGEVAQ